MGAPTMRVGYTFSPAMSDEIIIRSAEERDLPALGELGGGLVRMHHELDVSRFILPADVERGYQRWLGKERQNDDAIVLVAARSDGSVEGYLYGRIEERDWNLLLDEHAALHDILVRDDARGLGLGRRLVAAFIERVKARGVPRVVLHTAVGNERAQRLFRAVGFRPTMLEMTLDL